MTPPDLATRQAEGPEGLQDHRHSRCPASTTGRSSPASRSSRSTSRCPACCRAVFEKCPVFGGKVVEREPGRDQGAARRPSRVRRRRRSAISTALVGGVAIVADSWWQAKTAREQAEGHVGRRADRVAEQRRLRRRRRRAVDADPRASGSARTATPTRRSRPRRTRSSRARTRIRSCRTRSSSPRTAPRSSTDGKLEIWAPSQTPAARRAHLTTVARHAARRHHDAPCCAAAAVSAAGCTTTTWWRRPGSRRRSARRAGEAAVDARRRHARTTSTGRAASTT